jgi:3-hydroxyisobutyrate dehydrogenase-like beta-hydroxyacid dehydrogenase
MRVFLFIALIITVVSSLKLEMATFDGKKIGFVGVGIMGKGMIGNLATKLPNDLVIWNRSGDVCREVAAQYAGGKITIASTPADVVRQCDVTFCMLSTPEASEAVFDLEGEGVIAGVSAGKVIVDCATLSPERMILEAERIAAKGGKFLEAPVSGSKVPAEQGTLVFLCGGDEEVFQYAEPGLTAMGKAKFLFGPAGQGTRVKLIVNMVMGTMMGAFAEGMALCQAADLPQDKLLEVLDLGAMANPMFKGKGPNMISNTFAPHFPLKHAQKDMRLALELGDRLGVSLPTTKASDAVYRSVLDERGDEDFSAVYAAVAAAAKGEK